MLFESFAQLLAHYAAQCPESTALLYDRDGLLCRCSYGALYAAVTERARELESSGASCMGILADGSFDCVVEIFAANMAGLQIVMLDSSLDADTLCRLLPAADVDILWGGGELSELLGQHLGRGVEDGRDHILFFTSGTTSMSKAVALSGKSLCFSAYSGGEMLPLRAEDTLLCMLPLAHVFGFVCSLLWPLSSGAAVALGRGPRHYLDDLNYFKPTALSAVPSLLGLLLRCRCLNPELGLVLVGAGDCPPALLAQAAALGLKVSFGYGLTETSSGLAISTGADPYAMSVCPGVALRLAADGEILVRAPGSMMQGYYKQPEATAEVLQDGLLHTGDLGRFDGEGKLRITGRKKEMLVLSDGTKIFLPEYEAAVAEALGGGELAVCLRQGRPFLIYSGQDSEQALWEKLKPLMARIPRGRQLAGIRVISAPLPRTASGKLRRWELDKLLQLEQETET